LKLPAGNAGIGGTNDFGDDDRDETAVIETAETLKPIQELDPVPLLDNHRALFGSDTPIVPADFNRRLVIIYTLAIQRHKEHEARKQQNAGTA
jgi:hypothetical protein